jgi:hypothetical protein
MSKLWAGVFWKGNRANDGSLLPQDSTLLLGGGAEAEVNANEAQQLQNGEKGKASLKNGAWCHNHTVRRRVPHRSSTPTNLTGFQTANHIGEIFYL